MLTGCTLTGADESVDPAELLKALSPLRLAEIGILWAGPEKEGRPRYPGIRWLRELNSAHEASAGPKPPLALHLCGRVEKATAEWPSGSALAAVGALGFPLSRAYRRIQMNRALGGSIPGREWFPEEGMRQMEALLNSTNRKFILQIKKATETVREHVLACVGRGGSVLVDGSGGKGILPGSWPRLGPEWAPLSVGFAGGLSPENLADQLGGIAEANEGRPFWVDMESSLRDSKDGFSIERAQEAARVCGWWAPGARA